MHDASGKRPTRALLWVSLLQGACLYFLYGSAEAERWPATSPTLAIPLWTLAVIAPVMLLLSVTHQNWKRIAPEIAAVCALLTALAAYVGRQAAPYNEFPVSNLLVGFAVTIGIASFKALVHIQARAEGAALSYPSLFTNSWRNFLVGALGLLFALIFWLILLLWGGLFDALGVEFFRKLFHREWFAIPTVTLAFGVGVILFRSLTTVIDSITQLLHGLMKLLLPLLLLLTALFLLALPFTGLDALWATGSGTALLVWLLALSLFTVNAVYQDGRVVKPYPKTLDRAISGGICLTPFISGLAFHGLALRTEQYGWTVERCWAFVVWLVLSLIAAGYVIAVVRKRSAWSSELARVNTVTGLIVLGLMLLANSPLMDFRKLALASQIARVESGDLTLESFDYWYTRNHLARPGYQYMNGLKSELGDSNPSLTAEIENPTPKYPGRPRVDVDVVWAEMLVRPEGVLPPPELKKWVSRDLVPGSAETVLIEVDLDTDGEAEYLLIQLWPQRALIAAAHHYHRDGDSWVSNRVVATGGAINDLMTALLKGDVRTKSRQYRDFEAGGVTLSVNTASGS